MSGSYNKGDLIRLSATFTDLDDQPVDPTTVTVKYKDPSGTVTTKVYDTDAEVVKDSIGNYHIDVDVDASGNWWYRWESTGAGQAVEEAEFHAERSQF